MSGAERDLEQRKKVLENYKFIGMYEHFDVYYTTNRAQIRSVDFIAVRRRDNTKNFGILSVYADEDGKTEILASVAETEKEIKISPYDKNLFDQIRREVESSPSFALGQVLNAAMYAASDMVKTDPGKSSEVREVISFIMELSADFDRTDVRNPSMPQARPS